MCCMITVFWVLFMEQSAYVPKNRQEEIMIGKQNC